MTEICRFFGIIIHMHADDSPPLHFHAIYDEYEALIGIDPITILDGKFPRRAFSMTAEWAALHQQELRDNWRLLRGNEMPASIEPLD